MSSQVLRTGNEGVTYVAYGATERERRAVFSPNWYGICDCWWCYDGKPLANWPACYLVSVSHWNPGYAGPDGWVAGSWYGAGYLSYECMLERNPLYTANHPAEHAKRRWGTTSSPSAAGIADMHRHRVKMEDEELHYSKRDERAERRETKRAYRAAFKQGWRYVADVGWLKIGEDLTQPPRQDAE